MWVAVQATIVFLIILLFFSPKRRFVRIAFCHLSSPALSLITALQQQFKPLKLNVAGNVSDIGSGKEKRLLDMLSVGRRTRHPFSLVCP